METEKELLSEAADKSSQEAADSIGNNLHYYDNTRSPLCQALKAGLIEEAERWIFEFIRDIYDCRSEEWQHSFDVGEKLAELRHIINKAKEASK